MPASAPPLVRATRRLIRRLEPLRFGAPVTHVYNPLVHAWRAHRRYLDEYGAGRHEVVLLGMNPGPFGMVQTGVPFGEVSLVRDWLGIEEPVDRPEPEHPKRPVDGFACKRSEVSGRRLWSWCQERFGTPARFFAHLYVHNYCPLAFMEASGRNVTPDKLAAMERTPLFEACDAHLREVTEIVGARRVIGVGAFAEKRARIALADAGVAIGRMPHPSPASPAANRGWADAADTAFEELGVFELIGRRRR